MGQHLDPIGVPMQYKCGITSPSGLSAPASCHLDKASRSMPASSSPSFFVFAVRCLSRPCSIYLQRLDVFFGRRVDHFDDDRFLAYLTWCYSRREDVRSVVDASICE